MASRSGERNRILRLFLNRSGHTNNWIGVRLTEAPGVSTLGAQITLGYAGGRQAATIVAGDSFGAQLAPVRHFGLGEHTGVDFVEVRWPNGKIQRLDRPVINKYHELRP